MRRGAHGPLPAGAGKRLALTRATGDTNVVTGQGSGPFPSTTTRFMLTVTGTRPLSFPDKEQRAVNQDWNLGTAI